MSNTDADRTEANFQKTILACLISCIWLLVVSGPTDCSPPGSSVHGILQARTPEWVPASFPSPGISLTQDLNLRLLYLLHWQADSLGSQCLQRYLTLVGRCLNIQSFSPNLCVKEFYCLSNIEILRYLGDCKKRVIFPILLIL